MNQICHRFVDSVVCAQFTCLFDLLQILNCRISANLIGRENDTRSYTGLYFLQYESSTQTFRIVDVNVSNCRRKRIENGNHDAENPFYSCVCVGVAKPPVAPAVYSPRCLRSASTRSTAAVFRVRTGPAAAATGTAAVLAAARFM